jgi:hypothetical protein
MKKTNLLMFVVYSGKLKGTEEVKKVANETLMKLKFSSEM